jgi:hypothetical protein
MAPITKTNPQADDPVALKEEWLERLSELVKSVKSWAEDLGWSTRLVPKKMEDSRLGPYEATALLMQKDLTRVLLGPVARFGPGTDGIVDLYLMPAYDDIASLYFGTGQWLMHYVFPSGKAVGTVREAESIPLSKETLGRVLEGMISHASHTL